MAIYSLTCRVVSWKSSAKERFGYITRRSERHGIKRDCIHTDSGAMPSFVEDPMEFWEAADLYSPSDGVLGRTMRIALPHELNKEQQVSLVDDFLDHAMQLSDGRKMPFSYAIHKDPVGSNDHVHVLYSARADDGIERTPLAYFARPKLRPDRKKYGGPTSAREIKTKDWLYRLRKLWEDICNEHLAKAGFDERIDCRSNVDRGIEEDPQGWLGPAMHRWIKQIELLQEEIKRQEEELAQAQNELKELGVTPSAYMEADEENIEFMDEREEHENEMEMDNEIAEQIDDFDTEDEQQEEDDK